MAPGKPEPVDAAGKASILREEYKILHHRYLRMRDFLSDVVKTGEMDIDRGKQILANAEEVYSPADLGIDMMGRTSMHHWRSGVGKRSDD